MHEVLGIFVTARIGDGFSLLLVHHYLAVTVIFGRRCQFLVTSWSFLVMDQLMRLKKLEVDVDVFTQELPD